MSEANGTTPDQATPATAAEDCVNCATSGEKALAILAGLFGILIVLMAVDMFSGGRISGVVKPLSEKVSA